MRDILSINLLMSLAREDRRDIRKSDILRDSEFAKIPFLA